MAIVSSSLYGTVSGSAVANVVVDGAVTIPMMKRSGYPPHMAAAIEAVASNGGQIMPPVMGAAAFLIAEYLSVPYGTVRWPRPSPPASTISRCSSRSTWRRPGSDWPGFRGATCRDWARRCAGLDVPGRCSSSCTR